MVSTLGYAYMILKCATHQRFKVHIPTLHPATWDIHIVPSPLILKLQEVLVIGFGLRHLLSESLITCTVFAYGVTSSGKTHTMHGEQKSPGIIPLAVKDVFGIIQETPGREFLLRVSYLEIYNEVINDLLDPTGQNLRIREDAQGTYVEGIKEEVVSSPAHALSLIASGEEHRHVGSNNFNLLSSRSHTIFTLTIESGPRGENQGEDVTLSQLNLIDLAGSESSKTETTGLRRKEGSYINKSLLTLGTVISKLTDGKATHIPYRDSKLTRLLQSSLSGHGRISLICTVTPASSNGEETHNTLKFAHRSKYVEIKASQNKIMDDKSLIKKYQREISCLKQELQQLKRGMLENPYMMASNQEDLVNLKLQLEAGQVKLQSRLEEEEQAKAALMGRIHRLTKLILVSTKNTIPSSIPEKSGHRRRHSFAEDELAYLPDRKRDHMIDDDAGSHLSEISADGRSDVANVDELVKDYKRNRRQGMLSWFKLKKPDNLAGLSPAGGSESSGSGSPASYSKPSKNRVLFSDTQDIRRKSISRRGDEPPVVDSFPERTQAGDLFSATVGGRHLPSTGTTIIDQMDLLREQIKMLAGEVALCTSSLKRLSEQAASNLDDPQILEQMQKLKDEMKEKKLQIRVLEQRMVGSVEMTRHTSNSMEMSQFSFHSL
ncbi:Kinesin-like protein KIN-7E [Sarracenia purpurea var. burkii]